MSKYLRPNHLQEALDALSSSSYRIIAGATDFYPSRVGTRIEENILDISAIHQLRGIERLSDSIRIGALTTWTDLNQSVLPPAFDGIRQAAREIGSQQIQNRATIVGNVCNASPAADGLPCLLSLSAQVELASSQGIRVLPIEEFVLGNRHHAGQPHEMVTALLIPLSSNNSRSVFCKLGTRKYLAISTVMVSALVEIDSRGGITAARIAVGSCSPVARRLAPLESKLIGLPIHSDLAEQVDRQDLAVLSPISDIRASATYRNNAALTLVKQALSELSLMTLS